MATQSRLILVDCSRTEHQGEKVGRKMHTLSNPRLWIFGKQLLNLMNLLVVVLGRQVIGPGECSRPLIQEWFLSTHHCLILQVLLKDTIPAYVLPSLPRPPRLPPLSIPHHPHTSTPSPAHLLPSLTPLLLHLATQTVLCHLIQD